MKVKLKPGDTVRVIGERGTAQIRSILLSMHSVLLEKKIERFRNWNIDEVRLVKRVTSTNRRMSDAHRAKLAAKWRGRKPR